MASSEKDSSDDRDDVVLHKDLTVSHLSGELADVDLADVMKSWDATAGDIRERVADTLGCNELCVQLLSDQRLLKDVDKVIELSNQALHVVINTDIDINLIELNRQGYEMSRSPAPRGLITHSKLMYAGKTIWELDEETYAGDYSESRHHHRARLSENKAELFVECPNAGAQVGLAKLLCKHDKAVVENSGDRAVFSVRALLVDAGIL